MKEVMRSLYQCKNARCYADNYAQDLWDYGIYCAVGHNSFWGKDHQGNVYTLRYEDLKAGDSLYCDTCKDCVDYSEIGGKIYDKGARGWK